MNTGQMIITMAAMILLSTVILSVNRNSLNTTTSMVNNKYQILGVSLGTAIIEEATSKAFDAKTARNPITGNANQITNKLNLTSASGLGSGPSENNRSDFNDFDDYNNYVDSTFNASIDSSYSENDTDDISAIFKLKCKVYYIDPAVSPNLKKVNYQTWHKRMDVNITSKYLNNSKDTIKLSKVYSYFL